MIIRPLRHRTHLVRPMPGSKSHANRALVLASLSGKELQIDGIPRSDDVDHMVAGLRALGFGLQDRPVGGRLRVAPRPASSPPDGPVVIDCGLAGTTLRFLCAVAATRPFETILTGNRRMRTRPVGPLCDALRALGAEISCEDGTPPVRIRGTRSLRSTVTIDPSVSSQFVSALLLIAPTLSDGLRLRFDPDAMVSGPYVDWTVALLEQCGVTVSRTDSTLRIEPGPISPPTPLVIEGDWSAAGAFTVLCSLTGSPVTAPNLDPDSPQGDRRLATRLATDERTIDLSDMPDQAMNVAVWAVFRDRESRLTGLSTLRGKESDRIQATAEMLRAVGASVRIVDDDLWITPNRGPGFGRIDTRSDHRLAIAGTLLGLLGDGVELSDASCVSKSDPSFFEAVSDLHQNQLPIVLVGLRGAGKTTTGRALAKALGWRFHDTDEEFERRHGPIPAFVAEHGWAAFRSIEAGLADPSLHDRTVLALGGGAIETPSVRERLHDRDRCTVVWIQEEFGETARRVERSDRPSVTGAPVREDLVELALRRTPLLEEMARIVTPPGLSIDRRIERIRSETSPWRRDPR